MIIGGDKKMVIYDDIEPTNKLTIYDYGQINSNDSEKSFLIDYRLGNITIPKCDIQEPLKAVIAEFYDATNNGTKVTSDGDSALETVRVLEAAQRSLSSGGELISL
jgi:predicted dehydrogenase